MTSPAKDASPPEAVLIELEGCLSAGTLDSELPARKLASQDVYREGYLPAAVVSPVETGEIAALLRVAATHGMPVYVRGGGMSYTDACFPDKPDALVVDMSGMKRIREINATDLYVTVESGCTWDTLNEALREHQVRPIFWGPMSGKLSTVGGAMAQGAVTFGSSRNGPSMAAALGLEVVLGNGEVLETGSGGQPQHSPFYREYGPDLTGLMCGDAGAFGIKTAVTLRLEPLPAAGEGLSYSFSTFGDAVEAVRRVSRHKLATETFGAETALVKRVAGPPDIRQDLKQLVTLLRSAPGVMAGLKKMAKVAFHGRRFMDQSRYLVNFLTEGRNKKDLDNTVRDMRREIGELGMEVANTVAEFTRAVPFPDPMVLGPENTRLLPLHGVVPYSKAVGLHDDYQQYLSSIKDRCDACRVEVYIVYATCGPAGFLYECVIYWPDSWPDLHKKVMPAEMLAAAPEPESNQAGRALVEEIRLATTDLFYQHGCVHFQIGRAYPFARDRNAAALSLLTEVRRSVDPHGLVNPGALGV